jgi:long-chain acyl-CoA synthetase
MHQDAGTQDSYLAELRRVAAARPDATAVVDDARSITYGDLIVEVDERAAALADAGLQPGDRVALVAENSSYFLSSAFAVWEAGGVLATVYPATPHSELRYTLENADPVLALTDSATNINVLAVSDDLPVAAIDAATFHVPTLRTSAIATPTDLREPLFLICYSSGTTSRPKAIMLSQTALLNGARTYSDIWRLTPEDRTIVCLPMAWLYGLDSTSMATLLAGGTVIALRRARPDLVIDAIEQHAATFLPGVTTIFAKLVDHLERSADERDLTSLRLAVSGGEPRNEAAFARFRQLVGTPVHDTFCATESFPLITYDPVENPEPIFGSAGKVVPRAELKILDADGNVVPTGDVGEAFSRGPGLMLGYWRDPEQSAKAVTADGWYRTNDLVRMDEEGFVYVVGRLSDVIIRGGSNVSPAEVERVLREQVEIRDACVVGLPDPVYGEAVAAAVVLAEGAELDVKKLRAALAEQLASYKIPTELSVMERLPVNATTGKTDRRAVITHLTEAGSAA